MRYDIQEPTLYFKSTIDQNACLKLFHIGLVFIEIFGIVLSLTFSQFRHQFVSELLVQMFHVLVKSTIKFSPNIHHTLPSYIQFN